LRLLPQRRPPLGPPPREHQERETSKGRARIVASVASFALPFLLRVPAEAAWPTPLPLGRESMYADLNQGNLVLADQMLDDYWPARGHPPAYLPRPLTWTEDPYNDSFWRFMFYSLRYTSNLLWAFGTTGQPEDLDRLLEILGSYAAYDGTRPFNGKTFDNKHTAAYRAMVLVNTYRKLEAWGMLPYDLARDLSSSIARLGTFLADPRNYEPEFNHGFNEAAGLLLIATNFPELDLSSAWRRTAIDRLLDMLATNVDADGVDIENSPFYHYYVMGMASQIAAWAAEHEPELAPAYTDARRRMTHHAATIVQPDGRLPMLGATATTYVPGQDPAVYGPLTALDTHFAWVFTRGEVGQPPPPGVELFPVSGLFLMRTDTPPPDELLNQTFITFDSGVYRTDHSDLDALGLTYYSDGRLLLRDSGLFTYDRGVDREYFHGTRAHNTVVVDGLDQAPGAAVSGAHGRVGDAYWATGWSDLVEGVNHVRTVILLEPGLVVVYDRLTSSAPHRYVQTWHLFPGASLQSRGLNILARNENGIPALAISEADWSTLSRAAIYGGSSPMQGWYSGAYGSKSRNWALEYSRFAPSARFVTLIASGAHATTDPWIQQAWISGQNRRRIWVSAGPTSYTLTVIAQGEPGEELVVQKGLVGR